MWSDQSTVIAGFDVYSTWLDGKEVVTFPCRNVFRTRDGLIAEYRSCIDATPVSENAASV